MSVLQNMRFLFGCLKELHLRNETESFRIVLAFKLLYILMQIKQMKIRLYRLTTTNCGKKT